MNNDTKPQLDFIHITLTEDLETDIELLFATIVGEMVDGKIEGKIRSDFIKDYYSTRDQGRDSLMTLFKSWVVIRRKPGGSW